MSSFVNHHLRFTAWDPRLSPFLTSGVGGYVTGLQGQIGKGCIVFTGPDQDFHGVRLGLDPGGNHYRLLLNEVRYVSHGDCGLELNVTPEAAVNELGPGADHTVTAEVMGRGEPLQGIKSL